MMRLHTSGFMSAFVGAPSRHRAPSHGTDGTGASFQRTGDETNKIDRQHTHCMSRRGRSSCPIERPVLCRQHRRFCSRNGASHQAWAVRSRPRLPQLLVRFRVIISISPTPMTSLSWVPNRADGIVSLAARASSCWGLDSPVAWLIRVSRSRSGRNSSKGHCHAHPTKSRWLCQEGLRGSW